MVIVLYIPCQLIWRVKIKLGQKVALACSLCLTAVIIIFTVTRASGLVWQGKIDVIWEVYFQTIPAEVGLILVSTTAFRALFVSRAARNQHSPQKGPSPWVKSSYFLRNLLDPRRWMSKHSKDTAGGQGDATTKGGFHGELPSIPGATMTGMNTFINHRGEAVEPDIEFSTYPASTVGNQDTSPFSKNASHPESRGQNTFHSQSMSERFHNAGPSRHVCSHDSQPICKDTRQESGNHALSCA